MYKPGSRDSLTIAIPTTLYRLLLAFYPADFRRKYGVHMAQFFTDCCLQAYANTGLSGLTRMWVRTFLDWITSLIEEWSQRETEMTQPKFIRLSGWALTLGGFCMGLGIFVQLDWIRLMLYRTIGAPTTLDEYNHYWAMAQNIGELPSLLGLLMVVVGIHGLRLCYREKVGKNGQTFLDLSLTGGVMSITALVMLAGFGNTWWVLVSGLIIMFGSLALFGLEAGKQGILRPFQATLLLSGFWFPIWIALSLALEQLNGGIWNEIPNWIEMPIWTLILGALIMLGQTLQGEARLREAAI